MSELKQVVLLDGIIIHVGEWDYSETVEGEIPVIGNPLPSGAVIEERELEFSEERGWVEVGYVEPLRAEERIAELELIINELLLGGLGYE